MYDLAALHAALRGTIFEDKLEYFSSIGSTNAYALEQAHAGAQHGTVYLADEQTAGRGRGGHQWHSREGDGIYVSILVRPQLHADRLLWLSLITGMAVKAAVEKSAALENVDIRWPNDVLLGGRKCAGILVEAAFAQDAAKYAVIGIGLNVNHESFPEEIAQTATSLRIESKQFLPREQVLLALLSALQDELQLLRHSDETLQRFSLASSWVKGRQVTVAEDGGYTGTTCGLDERGFLRVKTANGDVRTVRSGGVRPANNQ